MKEALEDYVCTFEFGVLTNWAYCRTRQHLIGCYIKFCHLIGQCQLQSELSQCSCASNVTSELDDNIFKRMSSNQIFNCHSYWQASTRLSNWFDLISLHCNLQNSKVHCDDTHTDPDKNSANSNDNKEYLIEVSQVSNDDNKLEKHSSGGILFNNFSANNLDPNTRYIVTIRRRSGEQLR